MQINSNCSMQQTQMRKMDGSGGGQGGMKDIMQSLSNEDRNSLIEQLSSMDKEQRMQKVSEMKELDAASMSVEDYTEALFAILDKEITNKAENNGFSVYA